MKYSIDYKFVLENMPAHTREPSLLELIEAGIERAKKERKGYENYTGLAQKLKISKSTHINPKIFKHLKSTILYELQRNRKEMARCLGKSKNL